jgi:glucosamine--fructose-6-phosphate aminotransferase (isomerizing)
MPSAMQETMARQPSDLRTLLDDIAPVERATAVLRDASRLLVIGTGTSWHAAAVGAWFLRDAGLEAWAIPSSEAMSVVDGAPAGSALLAVSHSGAAGATQSGRPKVATQGVIDRARERGLPIVTIGARGVSGADIETVERETSSAHTASYLGALLRVAQIGGGLGRPLAGLDRVPDVVADALSGEPVRVDPPQRLIEFVGSGVNTYTAAEGALKVREAARIASEGLGAEQCLHGPLVALDERDALVALDGGDEGASRVHDVAKLAEAQGVRVHVVRAPADVADPLSVFPLTVGVQRIALSCAEALGTDPDAFGFDVAGRREAWSAVPL